MTCCVEACVACEVDGLPLDPVRTAELLERDRQGAEAFEAYLQAPTRPTAALGPPQPATAALSARERGQERRRRLDAAHDAYAGGVLGLTWQAHGSTLTDRRSRRGGAKSNRGRG